MANPSRSPLISRTYDLADDIRLAEAFRKEYEKIYGYADAGGPIEVRDLRSSLIGETPKPRLETRPTSRADIDIAAAIVEREIFHDGRMQCARFHRSGRPIGPAIVISGPAVIDQYDTTTFVPSGFTVSVDQYSNLSRRRSMALTRFSSKSLAIASPARGGNGLRHSPRRLHDLRQGDLGLRQRAGYDGR